VSRRRAALGRRGVVRVVCTGRGAHPLRTLERIVDQRWLAAQVLPDSPGRGLPWPQQVLQSTRRDAGYGAATSREERAGAGYAHRWMCEVCGRSPVWSKERLGELLRERYAESLDERGEVVFDVSHHD
jgi:hypothetical protein